MPIVPNGHEPKVCASTGSEASQIPTEERRRHRRYRVQREATLFLPCLEGDEEQIEVVCQNMAAGGLCIWSPKPVAPGRRVMVLVPPGARRRAEIVRCRQIEPPRVVEPTRRRVSEQSQLVPGTYELGVRFLT